MCTTASGSELLLIGFVIGGVLVAAPLGLGVLGRSGGAGGALAAGALLATLGALVALAAAPSRGNGRVIDVLPFLVAGAFVAAGAFWAWSARTGGPRARSAAFALTLAGAALGGVVLAVAMWPDPGACERLMRPPTPSPS